MVAVAPVYQRAAASLLHTGAVPWRTAASARAKAEGLAVTLVPAPRPAEAKGIPVMLVQGWACGSSDWGALPKMLALAGNRSVVSYDSRGIGGSPVSSHSRRAATVADLALETIEAAEIAGLSQAHVLGVSLGGKVVQELAALSLESNSRHLANLSLQSFIMCSTSAGGKNARGPPPGFFDIFAPDSISSSSSGSGSEDCQTALVEAAEAFLKQSVAPSWLSANAARPQLLHKAAQRFASAPRDAATIAAQAEAAVAFAGGERLSNLRTAARTRANMGAETVPGTTGGVSPMLVLHGSDDGLYPPEEAARLVELCGPPCEHTLFPGCGHLLFVEEPKLFVKTVSDFLARVEARLP
mmetsp:Transcript_100735/g.200128  ORF Transcript_100735/g.200128 Transcript_100735/m.200128 type:complete len:355 (-) Transcript_100735:71-1135(-)